MFVYPMSTLDKSDKSDMGQTARRERVKTDPSRRRQGQRMMT